MEFGEDRGGEAESSGRVREDLDNVGAVLVPPDNPSGPGHARTCCPQDARPLQPSGGSGPVGQDNSPPRGARRAQGVGLLSRGFAERARRAPVMRERARPVLPAAELGIPVGRVSAYQGTERTTSSLDTCGGHTRSGQIHARFYHLCRTERRWTASTNTGEARGFRAQAHDAERVRGAGCRVRRMPSPPGVPAPRAGWPGGCGARAWGNS